MIKRHVLFLTILFSALSLAADARKITVLQTTDIHGNFGGFEAKTPNGNWLKLSTLIQNELKNAGGHENTLLIDCGDTIQGTYPASVSRGMISVTMLNYLKYDVWILGNHDFDFGIKRIIELSSECKADVFSGNLKLNDNESRFNAWKIYRKNGLKIAVLGLTYPSLHNYLWKLRKDFHVFSLEKSINKFMPEIISESPDVIILAVHYGDTQNDRNPENDLSKIAERHPEINLILGGHFHTEDQGKILGSKVWYGCSGRHAEKLFKAEIEVDTEKKRVSYIKSTLLPILTSTPEDENAAKAVALEIAKAETSAKEKLGNVSTPIRTETGANLLVSSAGELLGMAISKAAGTELAITGPPTRTEIGSEITELDLFKFLPYEDSISTLDLKYDDVCEIISEQVRKRNQKNFQQPFGFYVEVDRQGNIKGEIKFADGSIWQDKSQRRTVAFSSYVLGGAGGKFSVLNKIAEDPASKASNKNILIRDAVRNYISENSPLKIKATNWIRFVK